MNAGARLGLYAAGVAVAFAASFGIAAAVAPDEVVAEAPAPSGTRDGGEHGDGEHSDKEDDPMSTTAIAGVSLSADGYALSPVSAPATTGDAGELSFQILTAQGEPLTAFKTSHDKDLHLIVVRTDGRGYRHVHPTLDEHTGTWSTPWQWEEAGAYRVYADFAPAVAEAPDKITLSRAVEVAGEFAPSPASGVITTDEVDGFEATITGELAAGAASELTISISRAGEPVTDLEPYLGAFGHLVALRDGDLAYLHVHAEGDEPAAGETSGPQISFIAQPPTAGRYLLYLDFQIDGEVRTAQFVLEAGTDAGGTGAHDDTDPHGH